MKTTKNNQDLVNSLQELLQKNYDISHELNFH